jgi:5-methylcytosine-specific restriction endonuclease McrBC GTP-binding regulatory subunit McrB
VLKRYCEDIRVLQLERKWTESPEWYTEQDLAEMEEQRLLRERQIQQDIEERTLARKTKREPRLLPFEIEEMEQRKGRESGEVPMQQSQTVDTSPRVPG